MQLKECERYKLTNNDKKWKDAGVVERPALEKLGGLCLTRVRTPLLPHEPSTFFLKLVPLVVYHEKIMQPSCIINLTV